MWVGWLEAELLLGDVRSLKQKRAVVRPVVAELRRLEVSVAEVGHVDLHRRALVGVALTTGDHGHADAVLDRAERLLASRPDVDLVSVRRRLLRTDDVD